MIVPQATLGHRDPESAVATAAHPDLQALAAGEADCGCDAGSRVARHQSTASGYDIRVKAISIHGCHMAPSSLRSCSGRPGRSE